MNPCEAFRRDLEAALVGSEDLRALGWHEHLLGCGECKALMEKEEALELLLTSLPRPALPPALAQRVLVRLRAGSLDDLLGQDEVQVPADLSARVLAGLSSQQAGSDPTERLEQLLDRAGEVAVPDGLAARVLQGLEVERVAGSRRAGFRLLHPSRLRVAAAALAAALAGVWVLGRGGGPSGPEVAQAHPDDAVIAWLPALEYWDEVRALDPLDAQLVENLDGVDALLLEEDG